MEGVGRASRARRRVPRLAALLAVALLGARAARADEPEAQLVIQTGQGLTAYLLAVSADGAHFATVNPLGTINLWRTDGKFLRSIRTPLARIDSLAFSPEGTRIACGGREDTTSTRSNRNAYLYDLLGRELRVFTGALRGVDRVVFDPRRPRLALAGFEEHGGPLIEIWDPEGGIVGTIGDAGPCYDAAGDTLLTLCVPESWKPPTQVVLRDADTLDVTSRFGDPDPTVSIRSATLSLDGRRVAVIYGDEDAGEPSSTIKLWGTDGNLIRILQSRGQAVQNENDAAFRPDGSFVAVLRHDRTVPLPDGSWYIYMGGLVRVWDNLGVVRHQLLGDEVGALGRVACTTDGHTLVSTVDGLRVWDSDGSTIRIVRRGWTAIEAMAFRPDGTRIVAGTYASGGPRIWGTLGRIEGMLSGKLALRRLRWTRDGRIVGMGPGGFGVWGEDGRLIRSVLWREWLPGTFDLDPASPVPESVDAFDVSPDGLVAMSLGGREGYGETGVFLIDTQGNLLGTLSPEYSGTPEQLRFSDDGRLLAVFGRGGGPLVSVWDVSRAEVLRQEELERWATLLAVGNDGTVIYDSEDLDLYGHGGGLRGSAVSAAFSPDGKMLATGGSDGSIKLWDREGRLLRTLSGHAGSVLSLAFGPDGRLLASGSADGSVRLWNTETGEHAALLAEGDDWVMATPDGYFDCSPDGGRLVAMVRGLDLFGVDQFAVERNRPDIILRRLGLGSEALLDSYFQRYLGRLARSGVLPRRVEASRLEGILAAASPGEQELLRSGYRRDGAAYALVSSLSPATAQRMLMVPAYLALVQESLGSGLHVPESRIVASRREGGFLELDLDFSDSLFALARYMVYVNDVPLFEGGGKPLSGPEARITERIELSSGPNKIEAGCVNDRMAESVRDSMDVSCEAPSAGELYFIGFGVSSYKNQEYDLLYPEKDVADMAARLADMSGAYRAVHLHTFTGRDCTAVAIRGARSLLDGAGVDDTVVLFISGHGVHDSDPAATYYYLTWEADAGDLRQTAADFELVEGILDGIKPRRKLFLMDTCESGELDAQELSGFLSQATDKDLRARSLRGPSSRGLAVAATASRSYLLARDRYIFNDVFRRTGAIVFSSSRGGELSYEPGELDERENGFFTAAVLASLSSPQADADADGAVSADEMQAWVSRAVAARSGGLQNPTVDRDNLFQSIAFPLRPGALDRAAAPEREAYLLAAIRSGNAPRIAALVETGIPVSGAAAADAFVEAAIRGDADVVGALLAAGLPCDLNDSLGRNVQESALREFQYDVVYRLIEAGAEIPAEIVVDAAERGRLDRIRELQARGSRIRVTHASAAIASAARSGRLDALRMLLEAGVDVNDHGFDDPALPAAIWAGHLDVAELLLEAGADVDEEGYMSLTPLMLAASEGHADLVRRLLDRGANPRKRSYDQRTALDMARGTGHVEVVRLLEQALSGSP